MSVIRVKFHRASRLKRAMQNKWLLNTILLVYVFAIAGMVGHSMSPIAQEELTYCLMTHESN